MGGGRCPHIPFWEAVSFHVHAGKCLSILSDARGPGSDVGSPPETGYVDSASSRVYKAGTMISKQRWKMLLNGVVDIPLLRALLLRRSALQWKIENRYNESASWQHCNTLIQS